MKKFALAAAVAAGLLVFASTAEAQYRSSYVYPTYGYSTYSYPSYSYGYPMSYSSPYSSGVVLSSGYTPAYSSGYYNPVYPSGYYSPAYSSGYYGGGYYEPVYPGSYSPWSTSTYGFPIYSGGYGGVNVTTRGAYIGGRRIGRW